MVSNGGNAGDIRGPCDDRVETPAQLAARVGVSKYQINKLICAGKLEHIQICGRKFVPSGGWPRYVEANTKGGKQWPDETMARDSVTSKIAEPFISRGPSMAAVASARLAQQAASRLKSNSGNGCNAEDGASARVILLKRS